MLVTLRNTINHFSKQKDSKNMELNKLSHAYKGYVISYNVETLNPDLQLKDTESAIRNKGQYIKYVGGRARGFLWGS